jgi:hypothetical protein
MWPFSNREEKKQAHIMRKFIAGVIIGGAIASIIGKHMLDKHEKGDDDDDEK